mmetsp:Transcript_47628/g.74359  ORF Transcript_47628/g.74359 Transcript_47628/m.74359 type:complete len:155 (+) Transcript_47628:681-1145(+)
MQEVLSVSDGGRNAAGVHCVDCDAPGELATDDFTDLGKRGAVVEASAVYCELLGKLADPAEEGLDDRPKLLLDWQQVALPVVSCDLILDDIQRPEYSAVPLPAAVWDAGSRPVPDNVVCDYFLMIGLQEQHPVATKDEGLALAQGGLNEVREEV